MYNSGKTDADLIAAVTSEADISLTITSDSWYRWINETEQMLYTEIIKERKLVTLSSPTSPVAMTAISPAATEEQAIFEDIDKVYADGQELEKASIITATALNGYKSMYYSDGGKIGISLSGTDTATSVKVIYRVRPKIKASGTARTIYLPAEFLELMACRLRGEAYKTANEDALAAKWLNDYNAYIEQFKVWLSNHSSGFGEN